MVNFVWRERWLDCKCLHSPKKHLFAVWILRCISRLTSFVGVFRAPTYTNSLTTSKYLSPITTLCPTSRVIPGRNHRPLLNLLDNFSSKMIFINFKKFFQSMGSEYSLRRDLEASRHFLFYRFQTNHSKNSYEN
jgi:hypothetical protein